MDSLHIQLISIFTAIDGRVVMLQPDNLKDEPDMSITSQELMVEKKDEGEEESFGLLTLIMVELRPVVEVRENCVFWKSFNLMLCIINPIIN